MDDHQSKHIFAEVRVHASVEQVWRVITDYDNLAEFVPNLVVSERLPSNVTGRIQLRQIGCSQSVFWRLEAEAVLECVEVHKAMGAKELRFKAIEGDFQVIFACLAMQDYPSAPLLILSNFPFPPACKLHRLLSLFVIVNTTHCVAMLHRHTTAKLSLSLHFAKHAASNAILPCAGCARLHALHRFVQVTLYAVCITTSGHDALQEYSGSWVVEPDPSAHTTTLLKYEISLQPKLSIPSAIVTCVVKAGLPANMTAMAKRAEQVTSLPPPLCIPGLCQQRQVESSIKCHL